MSFSRLCNQKPNPARETIPLKWEEQSRVSRYSFLLLSYCTSSFCFPFELNECQLECAQLIKGLA
jgi:hypothetical protein